MKSQTFKIRNSINKKSSVQVLLFEGDLGIRNAEAILKSVQDLKFDLERVSIHLRNIEKIDLTTIQTIRALRTFLTGLGKSTDVLCDIPQDIEKLLINTGFDKSF